MYVSFFDISKKYKLTMWLVFEIELPSIKKFCFKIKDFEQIFEIEAILSYENIKRMYSRRLYASVSRYVRFLNESAVFSCFICNTHIWLYVTYLRKN